MSAATGLVGAVLGCAVFGCAVLGSGPAAAASADCIEASRYGTLARVSNGDIGRLMTLLGRADTERPPGGACRSILLSGAVDAGSTKTLLAAIDANRGWVASVYLALSDGDIEEELTMAAAMRTLGLETVLLQAEGSYHLDFVVPAPDLPMSVSNGWTDPTTLPPTPLTQSVRDYVANVDLKLPVENVRCDYACWTVLAAGVERRTLGHAPAPSDGGGAAASDTNARRRARQGYDLNTPLRATSAGVVADAPIAMQPAATLQATSAACRTEIDYANGLRTAFQTALDQKAARDFPLMPLAQYSQQMTRIQDSVRGVKQCVVGVLERARRQAYEKLCGTACKVDEVVAALRLVATDGNIFGAGPR